MFYRTIRSHREKQVKNILRVLAVVGPVALLLAQFASGTPEYTKKENKQCIYCHTAMGTAELNDAGKYYKTHHTLVGYVEKKK